MAYKQQRYVDGNLIGLPDISSNYHNRRPYLSLLERLPLLSRARPFLRSMTCSIAGVGLSSVLRLVVLLSVCSVLHNNHSLTDLSAYLWIKSSYLLKTETADIKNAIISEVHRRSKERGDQYWILYKCIWICMNNKSQMVTTKTQFNLGQYKHYVKQLWCTIHC